MVVPSLEVAGVVVELAERVAGAGLTTITTVARVDRGSQLIRSWKPPAFSGTLVIAQTPTVRLSTVAVRSLVRMCVGDQVIVTANPVVPAM